MDHPTADHMLSEVGGTANLTIRHAWPILCATQELVRLAGRIPDNGLGRDIANWIVDCQARRTSQRTCGCYLHALLGLVDYVAAQGVQETMQITRSMIRSYIIQLQDRYNEGGVHIRWRPIRTFIRWYRRENPELSEGWNPIDNVHVPVPKPTPIEPLTPEDVHRLAATCVGHSLRDDRDRAIILALFDTGCRASEFLSCNVGDLDVAEGQLRIRFAKGRKLRVTFLGKAARAAVARYLRRRGNPGPNEPLWTTTISDRGRLAYHGLRQIMRRRGAKAGIGEPGLHNFRRGFAITCLRRGVDLITLQRLMGHSGLTVLNRYLAQTSDDLQAAHRKVSPVDSIYD